jgi:putative transposase
VWLSYRFSLSFRDTQELMLDRGIEVSHEAIRLGGLKFGAEYARRFRRRRGCGGDAWHLDEVFCKINGKLVYLWRALDQSGECDDSSLWDTPNGFSLCMRRSRIPFDRDDTYCGHATIER